MRSLGRNTKIVAVGVIAVAVSTFFSSMIVLEPQLFGRTEWSPHQISLGIWKRQLPVSSGHFELVFAVDYASSVVDFFH